MRLIFRPKNSPNRFYKYIKNNWSDTEKWFKLLKLTQILNGSTGSSQSFGSTRNQSRSWIFTINSCDSRLGSVPPPSPPATPVTSKHHHSRAWTLFQDVCFRFEVSDLIFSVTVGGADGWWSWDYPGLPASVVASDHFYTNFASSLTPGFITATVSL